MFHPPSLLNSQFINNALPTVQLLLMESSCFSFCKTAA